MTTARRLALRFGAMAFAVLFLQGVVSSWSSFRNLQEDARHDAVGLGRMAAGLVEPALVAGEEPLALEQLRAAQQSQESARFAWLWLDEQATVRPEDRRALESGEPVTVLRREGSRAHVLALVPLRVGARLGVVQVDDDVTLQASHVLRMGIVLFVLVGLLAAAFIVIGDRVGHRVVGQPVQRLISLSKSVGEGDLSGRVVPSDEDELGNLGQALNQMVSLLEQSRSALQAETRARLDAAERLRHADRLVTVGRLSAGIAHELGTPLNVVLLRAQLIRGLHDDAATPHAEVIEAQVAKMERIVKQLLGFARKSPSSPSRVELAQAVRAVRELLLPTAQPKQAAIELALSETLAVTVDAQALEQVLSNLVMNALQALPAGGVVQLKTGEVTRAREPLSAPRRWVFVEVSDDGPGLSPEVRERLFEPFVTTKPVGSGTGLGLSVAWGLVQDWGGWIEVSPPDVPGCRFTVFIPPADA